MTTYQNVFGSDTIPPSDADFKSLSITDDISLSWSETSTGPYTTASIIEVTSDAYGRTITLPGADEVSVGKDLLFRNIGAHTFFVVDNAAGAVVTVAAGEAKYIYTKTNATPAGTWGVVSYGVGSSSADASSLEGYGLTTLSGELNTALPVTTTAGARTISSIDRAQFLSYLGGTITWYLPLHTSLPNGFFTIIANNGTGTLTIDANTNGSTIDTTLTKALQPGESCIVSNSGGAYYSVGYGRSATFSYTQLNVDVSVGGVGGITVTSAQAANKLWYFYNTSAGDRTVTIPAVASVYFVRVAAIGAGNDLLFTTGSGSTVSLSANQAYTLYCDGTNIVNASSATTATSVNLDDGSAASPPLSFSLDTDTGIYRAGTNSLGITAGGVSVATFSASGVAFATPLPVASGGTGVATLTGIAKGNGTSAFSAATANVDYSTPANAIAMAIALG